MTRRRRNKASTPGSKSQVDAEEEFEEIPVEPEPPSSKPPVRTPPVPMTNPKQVKKDHLKDEKPEKGKKGKGKGGKGKDKGKGKGKKGKGKGEVASPSRPRSRPAEPPTPPPTPGAGLGTSSRMLADLGGSPNTKPKMDLPSSGFTRSSTRKLRCDFCRVKGHIARFCPSVDFRVSLTDGAVTPRKKDTDSNKPSDAPEQPPPEVDADVAIRLKERREVRRELKDRAREAEAALEEADRKRREREGLPHSVTPAEMKLMKDKKKDKKASEKSSSYYSTESEEDDGKEQAGGVRLVPKAEAKPKASDPDDPKSSSSSSSDDEEEGEEEQLEVDDFPPDEGEEAVKKEKESELFESSAAPVAAKTSAIPAGVEAKGQRVQVQLPKKKAVGVPKPMPSTLNRPETKRLADDREAMRRLREESRILDEQQEANKREKQRLQDELKALRQKRKAEESARKEQEEMAKKKKADDEAAAKKKADEKALAEESAKSARKKAEKAEKKARKEAKRAKEEEEAKEKENEEDQEAEEEGPGEDMALEDYPGMWLIEYKPPGWVQEWNRRTAEIQAKLKEEYHQELAQKIARQKRLPEVARLLGIPLHEAEKPFQRLQQQRAIPIETDPWARPAQFWNRPWKQVCEESKLEEKSTGKTVYFCGSQTCRRKFSDETAFWQHLNSKGGTAGHPSKKVIQSWNSDSAEFEPVRDLEHETAEERAQRQQDLKQRMYDAIKKANKAIEAMTRRAHGKDEEESSTSAESEDSQGDDEVVQEAKKFGLTIEKLPPNLESKAEVLAIPDKKALRQFFQAKREERDALKAKAEEGKDKAVEESTEPLSEKAKNRRAGMSAFGARMLSCTLDQVIEEIPGEMKGIEELATSPAGEVKAVEEKNIIPSEEVKMPVAAMTAKDSVPAPEEDRHVCRACEGSGWSTSDMNAAVAIILEAQEKNRADSEAQATQVSAVKEETEKEVGESTSLDDSKRRGDFTVSIGKPQSNLILLELCCGKGSALAQAAQVLNATYIGVHNRLESPDVRHQVLRALKMAGTGSEGKRSLIYCHVSLPCTGGSPLLNFAKESIREQHQERFLTLLDCLGPYLTCVKKLDCRALMSFELPHQNRYWSFGQVKSFRQKWGMFHHGVISCCRTGLVSSYGIPIGKRFRVVSNNLEFVSYLHKRFSECRCTCEHAAFNQIDWNETERYTKRFATFMARTAYQVRDSLS